MTERGSARAQAALGDSSPRYRARVRCATGRGEQAPVRHVPNVGASDGIWRPLVTTRSSRWASGATPRTGTLLSTLLSDRVSVGGSQGGFDLERPYAVRAMEHEIDLAAGVGTEEVERQGFRLPR